MSRRSTAGSSRPSAGRGADRATRPLRSPSARARPWARRCPISSVSSSFQRLAQIGWFEKSRLVHDSKGATVARGYKCRWMGFQNHYKDAVNHYKTTQGHYTKKGEVTTTRKHDSKRSICKRRRPQHRNQKAERGAFATKAAAAQKPKWHPDPSPNKSKFL